MKNFVRLNRTGLAWPGGWKIFRASWARAQKIYSRQLAEKKLSLVFITAAEARRLNRIYRQKSEPANILSFSSATPDELGDILICLPLARREAAERSQPLAERLVYLFGHGLLHLLGFKHKTSKEQVRFQRAEKKLCQS